MVFNSRRYAWEEEGTEEEAWGVIMALMDGPGSEALRRRQTRARNVLRQLCAGTLSGYPEWAQNLAAEAEEKKEKESSGGAATGAAAAGMVLSSEIRALKGALECLS